MMKIVGAGFSGLIAGSLVPDAEIFDIAKGPAQQHRALLRFRSDAVSRALSIEFRNVLVHKGIYSTEQERFIYPDIRTANAYSMKVTGRISDRSIWNLEPVTRFIAPEDLYDRLIERCKARLHWNFDVSKEELPDRPLISTMPMESALRTFLPEEHSLLKSLPKFDRKEIKVDRYKVDKCSVHQTIYFPDSNTRVYRASITGDMLIVESVSRDSEADSLMLRDEIVSDEAVFAAFGLTSRQLLQIGSSRQSYGKISRIDEQFRRAAIRTLSTEEEVYSLGRFACWRNILLDDIPGDLQVVQSLIAADHYSVAKTFVGKQS